jgi:aspartate kinase
MELLALLDAHGVSAKQLQLIGNRLTLVVSRENLHQEARVRDAVRSQFGRAVAITDECGAASAVGTGINASFHNLRKGGEALGRAGVASLGVTTSSFRITWLVPRAALDMAVRTLHVTFL